MPSLVAVACFLPGRAKDLSSPLVLVRNVGGARTRVGGHQVLY